MTNERFQKIAAMLRRRQPDLTVIMEGVHKTHNLAAIARTCDAVGISNIHAITDLSHISLSSGVAMGSNRWLDLHTHTETGSIVAKLKKEGYQILAAHYDADAVDYKQVDYTIPSALIVGQELFGVSPEALHLCDKAVFIPMEGMVKSLNVSVATAVVLYEAHRQRQKAGFYERMRLSPQQYEQLLFEKCYPELAGKYRDRGVPYPPLNENGAIIEQEG
ncbi:MAG: tRNA (guanosine(18)-2'-O)-methyltransferase TrmH [Calditrichaeota bacterium]|nr:MAG: tRNA (guanosine(18)-2'-O)-methyltransferase TrmH [Calditrichota bacterium]